MMKLPSLTRTNLANLMARRWRRSDGGNGGGDNAASQVATVQTDVRSFRAEAAAAAAEEVEEETIWNHPLFRLLYCVCGLNFGQFFIGLSVGLTATLVPQLEEACGDQVASYSPFIVAIIPAGQLLGALSSAGGCLLLGRRLTVVSSCLLSLFGAAGLAAVGQQQEGMSPRAVATSVLCFRLLSGVGMGASGASHPMYVHELCGAGCHWRGALNASGPVCVTLGIMVAFVMGTLWGWEVASVVTSVFPVVNGVWACTIPESPVWLVSKRKFYKARDALAWLRRTDFGWIDEEEMSVRVPKVIVTSDAAPSSPPDLYHSIRSLGKTSVLKPFLILNLLFFLSHFAGFIVVIFYGVQIFQRASPTLDSYDSTVLIGATQVAGGLVGTFLMASRTRMSNRRFLVVVSSSLCSSAMVALSLVTHFAGRDEIRGTTASWTALTLLVFFTLSYMTGLGPIPWILIGELLPEKGHAVTSALTGALSYVWMFCSSLTYPWISAAGAAGQSGAFLLYGAFGLTAALLGATLLPETRYEAGADRDGGGEDGGDSHPDLCVEGRGMHKSGDVPFHRGDKSVTSGQQRMQKLEEAMYRMSYIDADVSDVSDGAEEPPSTAAASAVATTDISFGVGPDEVGENSILEYIRQPEREGERDEKAEEAMKSDSPPLGNVRI